MIGNYHLFSYWLDIDGNDAERAAAMIAENGTLVGGVDRPGERPAHASFHVDESVGAIDEWTDAEDVIKKVSEACPAAVISMLIIDEDTKQDHRIVYFNGGCIQDNYSRIVSADDKFDSATVQAICDTLFSNGYDGAAELIHDEFMC